MPKACYTGSKTSYHVPIRTVLKDCFVITTNHSGLNRLRAGNENVTGVLFYLIAKEKIKKDRLITR